MYAMFTGASERRWHPCTNCTKLAVRLVHFASAHLRWAGVQSFIVRIVRCAGVHCQRRSFGAQAHIVYCAFVQSLVFPAHIACCAGYKPQLVSLGKPARNRSLQWGISYIAPAQIISCAAAQRQLASSITLACNRCLGVHPCASNKACLRSNI